MAAPNTTLAGLHLQGYVFINMRNMFLLEATRFDTQNFTFKYCLNVFIRSALFFYYLLIRMTVINEGQWMGFQVVNCLFSWCVQILFNLSSWLNVTYEGINIPAFVAIWPIITIIAILLIGFIIRLLVPAKKKIMRKDPNQGNI